MQTTAIALLDEELPSWTEALVYALEVSETDQESLKALALKIDQPPSRIKRYLRDPRILERRGQYLSKVMSSSVQRAQYLIQDCVTEIEKVVKGDKQRSDRTDLAVIHLRGVGFYGTRSIIEHRHDTATNFHKQVFEELNSKLTDAEWEEMEKEYAANP